MSATALYGFLAHGIVFGALFFIAMFASGKGGVGKSTVAVNMAVALAQQDFLAGRVVMMGCPKFDDQQLYVDRFIEIFRTRTLKSLTILIMEVPCCGGLLKLAELAVESSSRKVPVKYTVVGIQGDIIEEEWL